MTLPVLLGVGSKVFIVASPAATAGGTDEETTRALDSAAGAQ